MRAGIQLVSCTSESCRWDTYRHSIDSDCPRCGSPLVAGDHHTARDYARRRPMSYGRFGEVNPDVEAAIDAALKANREAAQR